mmetsp:Transcript_53018/g.99342  ORF Transcript_53018/g.99342 Transcript_53018/m.99342 type:complete len:250 (-) Transcript_53018:242-991(-)
MQIHASTHFQVGPHGDFSRSLRFLFGCWQISKAFRGRSTRWWGHVALLLVDLSALFLNFPLSCLFTSVLCASPQPATSFVREHPTFLKFLLMLADLVIHLGIRGLPRVIPLLSFLVLGLSRLQSSLPRLAFWVDLLPQRRQLLLHPGDVFWQSAFQRSFLQGQRCVLHVAGGNGVIEIFDCKAYDVFCLPSIQDHQSGVRLFELGLGQPCSLSLGQSLVESLGIFSGDRLFQCLCCILGPLVFFAALLA